MSNRGRRRRSKTWLIDGFNTLHADPDLARLLQREGPIAACVALERLCHAWVAARRHTDVIIIFDGRRAAGAPIPTGRQPGVTSIYMEDEADAELMRRVRLGGGRDLLVTADRAIVDVGVSVGAEVLEPRRWLRDVARDLRAAGEGDEKPSGVSPAEAATWLRVFGRMSASARPSPPPPRAPEVARAQPGPVVPPPPPAPAPTRAAPPPPRPVAPPAAPPTGVIPSSPGGAMSAAEVEAWRQLFASAPDAAPPIPRRRRKR